MSNTHFWEDYMQDVPICIELQQRYGEIKQEIENLLKNPNSLFDYPKYDVGGKPLYEKHWKAIPVSKFDGEFIELYSNPIQKEAINYVIQQTKKNCPIIDSIISPLEERNVLKNSFISELVPGSIINPHRGWTQNYMRVHLGIICDPECKITINNQTKTWEEGKILAFEDGGAYPHSVVHNGKTARIILSVDLSLNYVSPYIEKCKSNSKNNIK